jgi:hypothetical protein
MKKPTGKPGNLLDRHYRCLAIEHRTQDRANAAILGVDSAESSHCGDDGSKESDVDDDVADAAYKCAAEVDDVGSPPADIKFSPIHPENEVDDVDMGDRNNKLKRGGFDDDDGSSDEDE